jgi:hypothetical protein
MVMLQLSRNISFRDIYSLLLLQLNCHTDPLRTPLNWRTRLQVAIDVVAALVI